MFTTTFYERFVSLKVKLLERASEDMKDSSGRNIFVDYRRDSIFTDKMTNSLCSCNVDMMERLRSIFTHFRILGEFSFEFFDTMESWFTFCVSTTADRIYFSQFFIFIKKPERTVSLLEAIVDQEGDISFSFVIWSKLLYETCFIDDNLRQELIKSSDDYVVFPANLYARYLLSIAYRSLGQEENHSNNQAELIVLRERYSRIREFAPMLKIMSAVS